MFLIIQSAVVGLFFSLRSKNQPQSAALCINRLRMIAIPILIILFHYLISYLVCVFFNKAYDYKLSKLGTFLVVVLSGPLTLIACILIAFITPLSSLDAGLFDGGGALIVLLSLFVFPIVSNLLVKLFVHKRLIVPSKIRTAIN